MDADYIWSRDRIRALMEHQSSDVQFWVARRMLQLYPDMRDEALSRLPTVPHEIVEELLEGLEKVTLPGSASKQLLEFFQTEESDEIKARVAVLLSACGHELPYEQMVALPFTETDFIPPLAATDIGFTFLLRRLFEVTEKKDLDMAAYGVASGCAAEREYDYLSIRDSDRDMVVDVDKLRTQWGYPLPDVRDVEEPEAALSLLVKTLTEEVVLITSSEHPALAEDLERATTRRRRLVESIRAGPAAMGKHRETMVALLVGCAMAHMRDSVCAGLLSGTPSVDSLWKSLIMRPWAAQIVDSATTEVLRREPADKVLSSLKSAVEVQVWESVQYAFRCLEAAAIEGGYRPLLEAIEGDWTPDVWDDAIESLAWIGPGIAEAAVARWRAEPPEAHDMWWIERYPIPVVCQFLLEKFEYCLTSEDPDPYIELLGGIGFAGFFEPLISEWRPGEPVIGEAVLLIAALNGIADSRLDAIAKDTEYFAALQREDLDDDTLDPFPGGKMWAPLRCTVCKRTYRYGLSQVYLSPKGVGFLIADIIQCKNCGSIQTYDLTMHAKLTISGGAMIANTLIEEEEVSVKDLPYKGVLEEKEFGGRKFTDLAAAYHFVEKALKRDPGNADLHKDMGILMEMGQRADLALPHLLEVVKRRQDEGEAVSMIANMLIDQGKHEEAVRYIDELVRIIRDTRMDRSTRRILFATELALSARVFQETGYRPSVLARSQVSPEDVVALVDRKTGELIDLPESDVIQRAYQLFMRGSAYELDALMRKEEEIALPAPERKMGRNEPCPCGSGKKYKKCCGR